MIFKRKTNEERLREAISKALARDLNQGLPEGLRVLSVAVQYDFGGLVNDGMRAQVELGR